MEDNQSVFNIEKLYVKDMSIEVPGAPSVYLQREQPQINIELTTGYTAVSEGYYEVSITAVVTAKLPEDKVMFLVDITQSGVFQIRNIPEGDLEPVLMIGCTNILFPYAREAVSDAVTRAGFPPVLLSPVNFEGMYQSSKEQKAAAAEEPASPTLQ